MGFRARLLAPAKLNLRLKIEGLREDGYHRLNMLNCTIGLSDSIELVLTETPGVSLEMSFSAGPHITCDYNSVETNIAARAATEFFESFSIAKGAAIRLVKTIPHGAGLGGGSSDAAAVLRGLMTACAEVLQARYSSDTAYPAQEVRRLALKLGADVPYLIKGGFAHVGGIGETISALPGEFLNNVPCQVLVPRVSVPTREIFAMSRSAGVAQRPDVDGAGFAESARSGPADEVELYNQLLGLLENDLCVYVRRAEPIVGRVLDELGTVPGVKSGLTGSGSALFVLPTSRSGFDQHALLRINEIANELDLRLFPTVFLPNFPHHVNYQA